MCVFKPAGVACAGLWGPCGSAAAGLASEEMLREGEASGKAYRSG